MMDLAMNFDTDECLVTAMFDKGNRKVLLCKSQSQLLCPFTGQSTFLFVFRVKADNVMMRLDLIELFIFMVIAV